MNKPKKMPSGKWRVRVYLGKDEKGKQKFVSITEPTRKDAQRKAREVEETIRNGNDVANITVGQAIEKYIDLKSNILSPSTIKGYRSMRRNNLQSLMHIPLIMLTNQDIQKAINIETVTHQPKTVHNMHGLLASVIAVYRPELILHTTLPKKQKRPKTIPSPEEVAQLLDVTRGTDMYTPVLLASMLSLRRSEVCGLKWDDIDLKTGKITVRHALVATEGGKYVLKSPKTYTSYRTLAMPPILIDALEQTKDKTGYVIKMTPTAISCNFSKIIAQNGFDRFTFHSLRHFNASVMLALNLPDKYAMERGGWATPSVMKSVYQHTFQSEQDKYDKLLIDYFNALYPLAFDPNLTRK